MTHTERMAAAKELMKQKAKRLRKEYRSLTKYLTKEFVIKKRLAK